MFKSLFTTRNADYFEKFVLFIEQVRKKSFYVLIIEVVRHEGLFFFLGFVEVT